MHSTHATVSPTPGAPGGAAAIPSVLGFGSVFGVCPPLCAVTDIIATDSDICSGFWRAAISF